uniref:AlNc14C85G5441 protein n=1 Tax=Albugo laibachii Nc14 TaxID=890382 RepID=F0WFQ6_9STRA|nr:AlNc14C85G5441 [Albugo laibachii Nc14]|eukprot:CCA20040.1 AlNc14C85G5441 [Albugo laibachii Nc14]
MPFSGRSISLLAHLSLPLFIPVQSHTFMSCPLATFTIASWPNPSGSIDVLALPKNLAPNPTLGDQEFNLLQLQEIFKNYGSSSLYDFAIDYTVFEEPGYDKSCGTTKFDAAQPLPEEIRFSKFIHNGMCQIQCGEVIVMTMDNCFQGSTDLKIPVTDEIRKTCENTQLIWTYIASHLFPWQTYVNCVNIGIEGDPISDRAKQDCPYPDKNGTHKGSTPAPNPVPAPSPIPGPSPVPAPNPVPAPSPIPGPNPVPAPSPIPGPSPVPAPNPVPAPSPNPGPNPVPAPSPNPGPNPYPAPNPIPATNPIPAPYTPSPVKGSKCKLHSGSKASSRRSL